MNDASNNATTKRPRLRYKIELSLGEYRGDSVVGTSIKAENVAAEVMTKYVKMTTLLATPLYNFNNGLKIFGVAGHKSAIKELKENLISRKCIIKMLKSSKITRDVQSKALGYLMFLKRKRCSKVNSRGCADNQPQREYITKKKLSLPTIPTNILMVVCIINAMEHRKY